jgi:hypothetical protein
MRRAHMGSHVAFGAPLVRTPQRPASYGGAKRVAAVTNLVTRQGTEGDAGS